jgi:glycosyltransferase involved in cell wall biosynthesis
VYDLVHPWTIGGAERRFHEVARRLARRGHEVRWVGLKHWTGPSTRVTEEGVTLHGVPMPPGPLRTADGRRRMAEPPWFGLALARFPGAFRGDIVDCSSFPYFSLFSARLLARLGGATLVGTWLEFWGDYWRDYAPAVAPLGRAVEALAARATPHLVCISEHTRRALLAGGVAADKLSVVPCGVELDAAAPPPARRFDVVCVARLIEEKGVDLLLEALAGPDLGSRRATALIVGIGPEEGRLHALCARLGLAERVRFERFLPEPDLNGAVAAASAFVLPSRREGFGMVVLEAMARGTPVIVTRSPQSAAVDLVREGETGFLVDPDPHALGRSVASLLDSPALRERMGVAAREHAREFEWDAITDRLEQLYRELRGRRVLGAIRN